MKLVVALIAGIVGCGWAASAAAQALPYPVTRADEMFDSTAPRKFNTSPKASNDFVGEPEAFGQARWCIDGDCENPSDLEAIAPGSHTTYMNAMAPLAGLTALFASNSANSGMYMQMFDTALRAGTTAYTNTVNLVEPTAGASLATTLNFMATHFTHYYQAETNFWDQAKMNPGMSELVIPNYTACVNRVMGTSGGGGGSSTTRVAAIDECLQKMALTDLPEHPQTAGVGGGGAATELTALDVLFNPAISAASASGTGDPALLEDFKAEIKASAGDAKYVLDGRTQGTPSEKYGVKFELIQPTGDLNLDAEDLAAQVYVSVYTTVLEPWCQLSNSGASMGVEPGASGGCAPGSSGAVPNNFNPDSCRTTSEIDGPGGATFGEHLTEALAVPGLPASDSMLATMKVALKQSVSTATDELDCGALTVNYSTARGIVASNNPSADTLREDQKLVRVLARVIGRARILGRLLVQYATVNNLSAATTRQATAKNIIMDLIGQAARGDPGQKYDENLKLLAAYFQQKNAELARRGGNKGLRFAQGVKGSESMTDSTEAIQPNSIHDSM